MPSNENEAEYMGGTSKEVSPIFLFLHYHFYV